MKYLKSFAVISLLFILPGASWYFLQSGLDWRKVKAKELVPKSEISKQLSAQASVDKQLRGKTTLLKMALGESTLDKDLIDQFEDAYTFQYLTSSQLEVMSGLMPIDYDYILIDTSGDVRQVYKGIDRTTLTSIVEDIALVLPHRRPKDIKMKNQEVYDQ